MRLSSSSEDYMEEGDDHPAKQLANYRLTNGYTFFGTVHVKTSAILLIVFYMLLLAIFDFIINSTTMNSSLLIYATIVSTIILLAILLAQYGIWKKSSLFLLPLLFIQVVFGGIMILVFSFSCFIKFHCFLTKACSGGRLFMLFMGSVIFCVSHCYSIQIIWFCCVYFRYLKKKTKFERAWNIKTTDDEIDENILIQMLA